MNLPVLNNSRTGNAAASDPDHLAIASALAELLAAGAGRDGTGGAVRFGRHDRMLYSTDASLYQVEPLGVVVPASIDDAVRIVRFCAQRNIALLPRGGGTSLAGQCTNHALVMDFTPACRAVNNIDIADRTCTVEPGIGIDELNDILAKKNTSLFFAPDPATTRQCAIGGALGNNAAGARSIRYGRTSENIERIEVCLATGERLWLGPNAGRDNATARRLGAGVLAIVREHAAEIRARFPRTIRRNAGYGLDMILDQAERGATPETVDLSKLLCGSEGTLAVTLQAQLKLHPTPTAKGLAVVSFATLEDAIAATKPILDACLPLGLTAVELLDDVVLDAARGNLEYRSYVDLLPGANAEKREPKAALYVEFFGFRAGAEGAPEINTGFDALRQRMAHTDGVLSNGIATYTDAAAMLKAWALRKAGEPLLHGLPGARKPITFVEDNAVPVERLGEFVREFKKIVGKHGTRAAYWAHASVGVLHVRPMIDLHDPADRERMRAIAVEVADLARACGGIMSGEHGDGRVRGPLIERFFGPDLMRAFRDTKRLFDPQNLLNPGNIVAPGPIESITTHLRVDAASPPSPAPGGVGGGGDASAASIGGGVNHPNTPHITTFYDYSDSDGFPHAIEQCNGAGVCRKRSGVMCPSYQATLDERHSTRGRGNALRLAITGQFGPHRIPFGVWHDSPAWNDRETLKTLDLCLSCKACKSECPSNVDIAKLKAEYLAQGYATRHKGNGEYLAVPIPALLTGYVRILNRIGSATPGQANWANNTRPARAFINRVMKIHPKRTLPPFSRSLYKDLPTYKPTSQSAIRDSKSAVVIYADCFTTYNESSIGLAAANVLRTLGYCVSLSPSGCCGRSMISVGMLEQAIETIDATIERLKPAIIDEHVKAIVVCEPSCLSAIKDDWLTLKCRTPLDLREQLAAKAMLPEDFIDTYWNTHPISPQSAIRNPKPEILLHTHCHQKALWGSEASARLLRRLVGDKLKVLDTGCCGMAGSFGFHKDKYDLSMAIGDLGVLPKAREAAPDAIICATGTSCRHQIHDGAARRALHPIEIAERLLCR